MTDSQYSENDWKIEKREILWIQIGYPVQGLVRN